MSIDYLRDCISSRRLVVLRGFRNFEEEALVAYCSRWGTLLAWNFGYVLDVLLHEQPRNYLFSGSTFYEIPMGVCQ